MDRGEFYELSAGHALGALSVDDEVAYQSALAEHPEWAEIADQDAATAAALADSVSDVVPPATARDAVFAQIAAGQPDAGSADPFDSVSSNEPPTDTDTLQQISRRNWTRGIFALAASFVLLAVVGFGAVSLGNALFPQSPATVALEEIERAGDNVSATVEVAGGGEATAHWSESLGRAVIVTDGVAQLTPDETYQMWFVRGDTPVAAGTFEVSEDGTAMAMMTGALSPGDAIALSVEPDGGSPTGEPSDEPVALISTDGTA